VNSIQIRCLSRWGLCGMWAVHSS